MTNFFTSLSQRLSLAQYSASTFFTNDPPSFGSAGLESIFSSAAVEEAGSSGGVVNDWEFEAAAEELAVQDLGL